MKIISTFSAWLLLALVANTANAAVSVYLIDVDLFGNTTTSSKTGAAAIGSSGDFWNSYTRDDGMGGWRTFGTLSNVRLANGTVTSVGMTFNNLPGFWGTASPDPMYAGYCYPLYGGPASITITGLPAGLYDVYAYSPDGGYQVVAGAINYGSELSYDAATGSPPVWTEGVQYSRFENVAVNGSTSIVLNLLNGSVGGLPIISGFQVVAVPEPGTGSLLACGILGGLAMKRIRRTHLA